MFVGKRRIRYWACVVVLVTVVPGIVAAGEDDWFEEIHGLNAAVAEVISARRELAQFRLEQITLLQQRGHAAWFDVARQQSALEGLAEQQAQVRAFLELLETVRTRWKQVASVSVPARTREKVYLPSSLRVVGWIEVPSRSSLHLRSTGEWRAREESLLNACQQRLKVAEKRYASYQATQNVPAVWREYVALQVRLARVENAWIQRRCAVVAADKTLPAADRTLPAFGRTPVVSTAVVDSQIKARLEGRHFTAQQFPALKRATRRVLAAEWAAEGAVKSAELDVRRQSNRLQTLTKLHAQGFATETELRVSRGRLEDVQSQLAKLLEYRQSEADRLRELVGHWPRKIRLPGTGDPLESMGGWSDEILRNRERLCHLVELRKRVFELQGEQRVQRVSLRVQDELIRRLEQHRPLGMEAAAVSGVPPTNDPFIDSLTIHRRRELDSVHLEKQRLVAQVQHLQEQIAILRLEEERFLVQCKQQDRMERSFSGQRFVTFPVDKPAATAVGRVNQVAGVGAYDYWESEALQKHIARLQGATIPAMGLVEYACAPPRETELMELIGDTSFAVGGSTIDVLRGSNTYSSGVGGTNRGPVAGGGMLSARPRKLHSDALKNCIPVTAPWKLYPFGQLRTEERDRLPPGRPPWYLPGSPTNLR